MSEVQRFVNHDLLNRIFLEAVEIAFQECAEDGTNFGESKISFLVNSLVPTGYVLGTSYWFLFIDRKRGGNFFCVCERYGHTCGHKIDDKLSANFIDYCEPYYFPTIMKGAFVAPAEVQLQIDQHEDTVTVTVMTDHLELIIFDQSKLQFEVLQKIKVKPIQFCFSIEEPKGPLLDSFYLTPHPLANDRYGKVLYQLRMEILPKIVFCPNKMFISEDTIQKFTIMPKQKDYVPEDIYVMAPISQEVFKGKVYTQPIHTYIPPHHTDSSYEFVACKQVEIKAGTNNWQFSKSILKSAQPNIFPPIRLNTCKNLTPVIPKDLASMMHGNLSKFDEFGIYASSWDEYSTEIAGVIDVNDEEDKAKRIKPFAFDNKANDDRKANDDVPNDIHMLAKIRTSYAKSAANTADVGTSCNL